jgi:DNA-binding NarL/FixJ family response regulator
MEKADMSELRILVVDDDVNVRSAVKRLLGSREGWVVVGTAADGSEALGKAAVLQPDVVIMDVTMPQMNGLEATPHIKKITPATEVLIFSQHGSRELAQEAKRVGASGYVSKSRADSLLVAVEAVAEHGTFFQASES